MKPRRKAASESDLYRDVLDAADEEIAAAETPASDAQLKVVWSLWHILPDIWSQPDKASFLTDSSLPEASRAHQSCRGRPSSDFHPFLATYHRLIRGGAVLPLGPEYSQSVEAALAWTCVVELLATTSRDLHTTIGRAWQWEDPMGQPLHRLAILRATRELAVSDKGLLEKKCPSLAEIRLVQGRVEAYRQARDRAMVRVREAVSALVPRGRDVPRSRQAPPSWIPRRDVDRCYVIAALRALKLCSDTVWQECLSNEIAKLSVNQRRRFEAIHSNQEALRRNSTLPLQTWLIDNGPLITRFDMKKAAVFSRAGELGLSASQNDSDTAKWDLGFTFRRGRPIPDPRNLKHRILKLLSPRPRIALAQPPP